MPRGRLRWGSAEEFRAPRCGEMELPEAAGMIADLYGAALGMLASEVAQAYELPPGRPPLAWFYRGGSVLCASCWSEVAVVLERWLRCADCGATASTPEWWSR